MSPPLLKLNPIYKRIMKEKPYKETELLKDVCLLFDSYPSFLLPYNIIVAMFIIVLLLLNTIIAIWLIGYIILIYSGILCFFAINYLRVLIKFHKKWGK